MTQDRFAITLTISGLEPGGIDHACPHGFHMCDVCGSNESARAKCTGEEDGAGIVKTALKAVDLAAASPDADVVTVAIAATLAAEVRRLQASERLAWDQVNYPTPSSFVHCYPHKATWVRGAPDEGCPACKLESQLQALESQLQAHT